MGKTVYVLITIDTECDKDINWEIPQPISFKNIALQKELLEPLFDKYGIKPTYLLSPEVLKDDSSLNILKSINRISFGTHLHEEFIEPTKKQIVKRTSNPQINLSEKVERIKLKNLTQLFYDKMGYWPKCFRSGRFGSSKNTCGILQELGYEVDSSVTPFKTLYFDDKKIDSWHLPLEPYFVPTNIEGKPILEVPLTLINKDYEQLPKILLKKLGNHDSMLKKAMKKMGYTSKTKWLRPFRTNGQGLINITEHVLSNHFKNSKFAILNVMFHSNEILAKASPYCQTKEEVDEFVNSLDVLFDYIDQNYDLCSISLEDVYSLYFQN